MSGSCRTAMGIDGRGRRFMRFVALVIGVATVMLFSAAQAVGTTNGHATAAISNDYSGTITYTRSFSQISDPSCGNNGVIGSVSDDESWQLTFSHLFVDVHLGEPSGDATGQLSGSIRGTVDCPDGFSSTWDYTQPGSVVVELACSRQTSDCQISTAGGRQRTAAPSDSGARSAWTTPSTALPLWPKTA